DHRAHHVADVRRLVDGRPAQVHPHLAGNNGLKILFLPGERIVDAESHEIGLRWGFWNSRQNRLRAAATCSNRGTVRGHLRGGVGVSYGDGRMETRGLQELVETGGRMSKTTASAHIASSRP